MSRMKVCGPSIGALLFSESSPPGSVPPVNGSYKNGRRPRMSASPQTVVRQPHFIAELRRRLRDQRRKPDEGTPSPSKPFPGSSKRPSQAQLLDFKNKQQSFDLHIIQVEECEEEEIVVDSDEEPDENMASGIQRAVTPTPIQDFGANTVYTEGPQLTDFLRVKTLENDCYTDVSDADTEDEE